MLLKFLSFEDENYQVSIFIPGVELRRRRTATSSKN